MPKYKLENYPIHYEYMPTDKNVKQTIKDRVKRLTKKAA